MKYVILILALLVGLPSAAHAADAAEEDCASYSSDVFCDVDTGHCIEPYAECVSRSELGGHIRPGSLRSGSLTSRCIVEFVTGWQVIYRSGRYQEVKLWRCGWGHFLTFSDFYAMPGHPRVSPFEDEKAAADADSVMSVNATEVCNRDCGNYSHDRICLPDGTCTDSFAECHEVCMDPLGGMAEKKLDTAGVQCAPTGLNLTQTVRDPACRMPPNITCAYRSRPMTLWRCGSFHWLSFGEWGPLIWK
jgi:hypothetical protein